MLYHVENVLCDSRWEQFGYVAMNLLVQTFIRRQTVPIGNHIKHIKHALKDPSQPHLCYCLQSGILDRITRRT